MDVPTALDLINALVYKPGWRIFASDHRERFESTILVRIDYPCHRSERELAPDYTEVITAHATFPIVVGDCQEGCDLYRRIIDAIIAIEVHEAREFLRVQPTLWAPFHPHHIDGMKRWGTMEEDLSIRTRLMKVRS